MSVTPYGGYYAGRRVMITGGMGFIGSNLARQLVKLGARVLIIDSLLPHYGGNLFNIEGIQEAVTVNIADIRDRHAMGYLVQGQDIIFNLAGQLSHIDSMQDPYTAIITRMLRSFSLLPARSMASPVTFRWTKSI
jgi:UDP-glucose 4-epimerase